MGRVSSIRHESERRAGWIKEEKRRKSRGLGCLRDKEERGLLPSTYGPASPQAVLDAWDAGRLETEASIDGFRKEENHDITEPHQLKRVDVILELRLLRIEPIFTWEHGSGHIGVGGPRGM
jgi:hypothetical protein